MPLPIVAGIVIRGLASAGLRRLAAGAAARHLKKKGVQKIVNKYGKAQFQKSGKFVTDPGPGGTAKAIKTVQRWTTSPFGSKTRLGRVGNIAAGGYAGYEGGKALEYAKQDAAMSSPYHDSDVDLFKGKDMKDAPSMPSRGQIITSPKPKSQPKKPWVKKGGKATGFIKDYAIGSEARRKEYDARGWKYDETIKGYDKSGNKIKSTPVSSIIKKPIATPPAAPKTTSSTSSKPKDTVITSSTLTNYLQKPSSKPFSKRGNKLFSDMVSIRAEVNKITGGGVVTDREQRKVQRLKKKYDRKEKRFQKHRPSISDAYKVNL